MQNKRISWNGHFTGHAICSIYEEWMNIDDLTKKNLVRLMNARGLKQIELADKIETTPQHLNAILRGDRGLGSDLLTRVCNALGVQPWEFYVTEQTPCIIDEKEKQILYTIREAEKMGVAEDIARYGQFRIAEAKKTKTAAPRKSRGTRHKTR